MIKCPNCTGELNFDVNDKVVKCQYCGSEFSPKELKEPVKMSKEEDNVLTGKVYSCSQCGANLMAFDETAVTFCSYCGSQAMIESKMMNQTNPKYIIPFEKNKEECIRAYKNKVNKSLFVPNYMKSDMIVDKFRGIYIPYCIYKLSYKGENKDKGSKYSHSSGDYQYYDDYTITYDADVTYEGLNYDLASKFYDKYSAAIPFDYRKKQDYNPNYVIGFYADTKDVESEVYSNQALDIANKDYTEKAKKYRDIKKYGCSNPKVPLSVEEKSIALFPLYFLAIRSKDNEKVNYAVVNGQTGKVVTELPISFIKYIIGSLLLAIIIFLLINSRLILTPSKVSIASTIFGIISLFITTYQISKLKDRERHEDDLGLMSKDKEKKKSNPKILKHIWIELLAIIIPIVILMTKTPKDIYYYEGAIVSLILVIISFRDIVLTHNELVTTKLPQLEKRGGDESE